MERALPVCINLMLKTHGEDAECSALSSGWHADMTLLFVSIPDASEPDIMRENIESNAIALPSDYCEPRQDSAKKSATVSKSSELLYKPS